MKNSNSHTDFRDLLVRSEERLSDALAQANTALEAVSK